MVTPLSIIFGGLLVAFLLGLISANLVALGRGITLLTFAIRRRRSPSLAPRPHCRAPYPEGRHQ